jgi:TRAP-type C4-dicarboxylate transport system permease small subunit
MSGAAPWPRSCVENAMLRKLIGGFDRAAAIVACALVVALLVCVALGVVTRGFGDPLIWTDELSRFLMVWLAVFGWILGSRKRIHVRIRYFQDLLPPRAHDAVELFLQLALTLFGVLVTWYSVGLVAKNHDLNATSLPISMAWMYVPMVAAGIATAVQGAAEFVQSVERLRARAVPSGRGAG